MYVHGHVRLFWETGIPLSRRTCTKTQQDMKEQQRITDTDHRYGSQIRRGWMVHRNTFESFHFPLQPSLKLIGDGHSHGRSMSNTLGELTTRVTMAPGQLISGRHDTRPVLSFVQWACFVNAEVQGALQERTTPLEIQELLSWSRF